MFFNQKDGFEALLCIYTLHACNHAREMSACFLIEFTYEKEVYDAKICNVRGDGSCFWHALDRSLGLSTQTLKTKTAHAMERARRQKGALWLDFQAYVKHALDVPSALSGYALLDTLHKGSDPVELVRRPHQYVEEWMFPFVCAAIGRDLVVVCHQSKAKGYRAYAPCPRKYPHSEPVFVYKEDCLAHYRAVEAEPVWTARRALLNWAKRVLKEES